MDVVCVVMANDGDCCSDGSDKITVQVADAGHTYQKELSAQVNGLTSTVECVLENGSRASIEVTSRYRCENTDNGEVDYQGRTCDDYTLQGTYVGGQQLTCATSSSDLNYE